MRVYDPTTTTLSVNWEPAEGPVRQYRIRWRPKNGYEEEKFVSVFYKYSPFGVEVIQLRAIF